MNKLWLWFWRAVGFALMLLLPAILVYNSIIGNVGNPTLDRQEDCAPTGLFDSDC